MKDWTGNRKSMFVTLGASNHTDKECESNDFYATDPIAIEKLVKVMQLPRKIWECACGTGCLSDRLKELGHDVVSTDLVDRGYGKVSDFLETTELPNDCTCILTNPPYKYALDFIKHSLELLPDDGLCIMFLNEIIIERLKKGIVCIEDIAGDVLDSKPILSCCKQKVYDYFLVIHVKSLKKVTLN